MLGAERDAQPGRFLTRVDRYDESLSPRPSANPQVRALAILILDEPTAALDAVSEAQVFEAGSGRDALRS